MKRLAATIIMLVMCAVVRGQVYYDSRSTNTLSRFTMSPSVPFTAMAWVRFDGLAVSGQYEESVLINIDPNGARSSISTYYWGIKNRLSGAPTATGIMQAECIGLSGAIYKATNNQATVLGRWYHIAGSYTATNVSLYVDGLLVGTSAVSETLNAKSTVFIGAINNVSPHRGTSWGLNGYAIDARIYSRALSPAEHMCVGNAETAWMHAADPALVLRTCITTNDTGTALTGVAYNYGTGADGTYSNSPTVAKGTIQTRKPRRAIINTD